MPTKELHELTVLYHPTSKMAVPYIQKDGLKPGRDGHVHLMIERVYAEAMGGEDGIILMVDTSKLSVAAFSMAKDDPGKVYHDGIIPPDAITVASEPMPPLSDPRWEPVPGKEHDYDGIIERSRDPRLPD